MNTDNLTLVTDLTAGDLIVHPVSQLFFGTIDGMVEDTERDVIWLYVEESREPIVVDRGQMFAVIQPSVTIPDDILVSLFAGHDD